MRNVIILLLCAALAFVSYRLIDIENQRYALLLGMCPGDLFPVDPICLHSVETRTSWAWHLYYGLAG
jgi:hypothetical protein